MPFALILVGVVLGAAALQAGTAAGHALWPLLVIGGLAFIVLALTAWHRRKMAEIHELITVELGRWRRVNHHLPWPKACRDCGMPAHDWKSTRAHDDTETSPCMQLLIARDAAELTPAAHYDAEVIAGAGGRGDGSVDTMTDQEEAE
jgi:hypothetical protein